MTNFDLWQRDGFEWLESLADESIDLIVTDPPYESLEKHRARGTTTRLKESKKSKNKWFSIIPNTRLPALFEQCYRVLKPNAHLYLFCDSDTYRALFVPRVPAGDDANKLYSAAELAMFGTWTMGEAAGFKFWKPTVWDKVHFGMGYHYRSRYEFVLFFEKGKRKLNDLGTADVITAKRVINGYPTEKPVSVNEVFIKQSSQPGELVIDPFFGSGSCGVAALQNGRRFAGADISDDAIALATKRLSGITPVG